MLPRPAQTAGWGAQAAAAERLLLKALPWCRAVLGCQGLWSVMVQAVLRCQVNLKSVVAAVKQPPLQRAAQSLRPAMLYFVR